MEKFQELRESSVLFPYACDPPSQPGLHLPTLGFGEREVTCVWSRLPWVVVSCGSQPPRPLNRAAQCTSCPCMLC